MAELTFKVPGMTAGNGAKAITRTIRRLNGVTAVEVDLHTGWVVVVADRIDTDAIRAAVDEAGYSAEI